MEGAQKVVVETKPKPPASTWRADVPGVFSTLFLAIWVVLMAVKIKEGNSRLLQVFAALAFFKGVSQSLHLFLRWRPEITAGLTPEVAADFLNTSVSLVYCSFMSLSVIGLMMKEAQISGLTNMLSHDELFYRTWPGAYTAVAISCGFFAYDKWDLIRKHLYSAKAPYRLVHHAVLLTCFTPALQRDLCINYSCVPHLCLVHSVFLHLRKLRKLSSTPESGSSWFIFINWTLNWITFFLTRMFCHIWITAKLLRNASKFPPGFAWPLAISSIMGLNVLNVWLGQGLYKALQRERSSLKRRE